MKKNFIFEITSVHLGSSGGSFLPAQPASRIRRFHMSPINLRMLVPGQKANILKISAMGELGRRIRDMGLVPGTQLEVIGKAPLRDPVALRIEGTTIALRNSEADHITVEVVE